MLSNLETDLHDTLEAFLPDKMLLIVCTGSQQRDNAVHDVLTAEKLTKLSKLGKQQMLRRSFFIGCTIINYFFESFPQILDVFIMIYKGIKVSIYTISGRGLLLYFCGPLQFRIRIDLRICQIRLLFLLILILANLGRQ